MVLLKTGFCGRKWNQTVFCLNVCLYMSENCVSKIEVIACLVSSKLCDVYMNKYIIIHVHVLIRFSCPSSGMNYQSDCTPRSSVVRVIQISSSVRHVQHPLNPGMWSTCDCHMTVTWLCTCRYTWCDQNVGDCSIVLSVNDKNYDTKKVWMSFYMYLRRTFWCSINCHSPS